MTHTIRTMYPTDGKSRNTEKKKNSGNTSKLVESLRGVRGKVNATVFPENGYAFQVNGGINVVPSRKKGQFYEATIYKHLEKEGLVDMAIKRTCPVRGEYTVRDKVPIDKIANIAYHN